MRTLKQINEEISHWVQETDRLSGKVSALEQQIEKISPNRAVMFGDIRKRESLTAELRSQRAKLESATREQGRLRAEAAEVQRHISEMQRGLSVYERQIAGGIDWTRVEGNIDRTAHLAELAAKAEALRAQIGVMSDA